MIINNRPHLYLLGMKLSFLEVTNQVQSRTLTIFNVTNKSLGTYRCLVQANIGNYSESINLQATFTNQGMGLQFVSFILKNENKIKTICSSRSYGCHCFGFDDDRRGTSIHCHYYFSRQIS